MIKKWKPITIYPNKKYANNVNPETISQFKKYGLERYIVGLKINWYQLMYDYFTTNYNFKSTNFKKIIIKLIHKGIKINDYQVFPANKPELWLLRIHTISTVLYDICPDIFVPYLFECEFNKLNKIYSEFEIPLPEIPVKKDFTKRFLYYFDLCNSLHEFRKLNELTPEELCAFLFDFALNNIEETSDPEIPDPSKVWFVGGNKYNFEFLDNATPETIDSWQCNPDARKGDIIVMYCLNPRSYIHSIWRANSDGFIDPFFHFYTVAYISNPIFLEQKISFKDLANNPIWSKNPKVNCKLQGINGYPIKYDEYLELLSMLKKKGQNIKNLPLIKVTHSMEMDQLTDERDVEVKLIEPFFKLIGFHQPNWIRQMPVKMGRGERYYPDYCFDAKTKRGEESAWMIVESKYEVSTNKQLLEAYYQTKSYALRLQSEIFIIASKEGIWIFKIKDGNFKLDDNKHFNWIALENPDSLHEIKNLIKKTKHQLTRTIK